MSAFLAYLFSAIMLGSALRAVTCLKPVHSLLAMIVCLLALSGLFFVLGAPFVGAIQVVVYTGAIMVLFVFVLMMLNLGKETEAEEQLLFSPKTWLLPACGAGLIFVMMLLALMKGELPGGEMLMVETVDAKSIAVLLYGPYVILVEAAALLLLSALVAAYHVAKKDKPKHDDAIVEEN